MPTFFYTDENGNKQGPLSTQQLQSLINRRIITPTTPLETDSGHTGLAGQIPGLNFDTVAPSPFAQPAQATRGISSRTRTPQDADSIAMSTKSWLFDFAFQDIRLPKNGRQVCSFIYICCVITLAINGLLGFFLFNPMYSPETMTAAIIFLVCYLFSSFIFLVLVRVVCELLIVLLEWIAENKKASRLYIENNKEK